MHFTGEERDQESGNDYFGARYYASTMGRFMSPDPGWFLQAHPSNPQTWNMYSYVLNNPLAFVDPTGNDCVLDNGDGTVTTNTGDCDNSTTQRANNEYYIDCDGCTSNATGANLDQATGTLSLVDSNGQLVNQNAAISGFADPKDLLTTVVVNGNSGNVLTTGYGGISGQIPQQSYLRTFLQTWSFSQWAHDMGSCLAIGLGTAGNDLNPFSPGATTPTGVVQDYASGMQQAGYAAVAAHIADRGLTVPLRSSIVRAGLDNAELAGKVSGAAALLGADIALAHGVWNEATQCQ
jgi:RHS repeat-associated protein